MGKSHSKLLTPLRLEQWMPWLLAPLCGIASYLFHWAGWIALPVASPDSYLAAVISLGGVFAGFMATLTGLLYGVSEDSYQRLKKSGYLLDLLRYLREAIWASLAMCAIALLAIRPKKTDEE